MLPCDKQSLLTQDGREAFVYKTPQALVRRESSLPYESSRFWQGNVRKGDIIICASSKSSKAPSCQRYQSQSVTLGISLKTYTPRLFFLRRL